MRHGIVYESNRNSCINCIKKYLNEDIVVSQPFFFLKDNVDIIQEFFTKDESVKEHIFQFCFDSDAVQTLKKAIRYYKVSPTFISKLSFPAFRENIKMIDMSDVNTIDKVIEEVCMYSRWDFLPYIFDNIELNEKLWINFKIGLFRGHCNVPFIKTLFHLMEKKEIPLTKLKSKNNTIFCSKEVGEEIKKYNIEEVLSISIVETELLNLRGDIANLFNSYRNNDKEFVISQLYLTHSHLNNRFLTEVEFVNALIFEDKLGWPQGLKNEWSDFLIFTSNILKELEFVEEIIQDYNSIISIYPFCNNFLLVRIVNSLLRKLVRVTTQSILKDCAVIISNARRFRNKALNQIREILCISDWEFPENPKLEDEFIHLYLYSAFRTNDGEDEVKSYADLIQNLRDKKFNKIADEVKQCMVDFVPSDDVKKLLRKRKIIE